MRLLVLLAVLQAGCLSESDEASLGVECGPRDLTPECCLKKNPGQWERCTGSSELARVVEEAAGTVGRAPSLAVKVIATGTAGAMVTAVHIGSAERRGVALAADLLKKVEEEIVRCVRRAEQEVNDYHFEGKSPTREQCQEVKVGERTTWAAYLGLFKHETAWPCLRKALDKLWKEKYLLHPRFYVDPQTGEWRHMPGDMMSQIVEREGWSGLRGTIEPDIVLLDANGVVIHAYDLKFPCPGSNSAKWETYGQGDYWRDWLQGDLYESALKVQPLLVSPRGGVSIPKRQ
ncbi:hypothetical protein ATI61_107590 [Archangium gephyra]|uniref:Lipoprotein n=1 Tax=Archangium gephyra TaxID=48 RepID=A0AAC8QIR8_9BACT|nr:hypothetical protein [Archangium gephyra]AKJ08159.1 putative lipoprotein [Archangium gephyra]REG29893.1 hypothetical protein ATI61_107590 [Archangium gephyra]